MKNNSGVTLIEMMVAMIIMATMSVIAIPRMRSGVENHQARQVIETARTLAHAIKMYEDENGVLPPSDNTTWTTLENNGYIKINELANYLEGESGNRTVKYTYSFVPNNGDPDKWSVVATSANRTLTVQNNETDYVVTDSANFFRK